METDLILDGAMADDGSFELEDFERIVIDHQRQIYRTLLLLVRDQDAAEILTQECFLRAFEKRDSFRGKSSLNTWLIRIAINLAKDHNKNQRWAFWRKIRSMDQTDTLRVVDASHSPEERLIETERVLAIHSALGKLSEQQRIVFLMRFIEDMPLELIAQALELKLGTVKAHLYRAIDAVKKSCQKQN